MRLQLPVTLLAGLVLAAAGCDTPIMGQGNKALINLDSGPRQGGVTDQLPPEPKADDPRGSGDALAPADTDAALAILDAVRADLHLEPLRRNAALTSAAQAHADYLRHNHAHHEAHGVSPHRQVPGLPGFTGATASERAVGYSGLFIGEVIGYHQTPAGTMQAWIESLYHRLPLIRAEAGDLGVGAARTERYHVHVVEVGSLPSEAAARRAARPFIAYPPADAVDVPAEWSGREVPQPQAPPQGYPSGPVITLSASAGALSVERATVAHGADGAILAATVLTRDNDPHLQGRDVAVIPHLPLDPGTRYVVTVSGRHDGKPFHESWAFTTGGASCEVGADDCGPGRACYAINGELQCRWEGAALTGQSCTYLDDCADGSACLGSQCRAVCTDGAGPQGCGAVCPDERTVQTSVQGVNLCMGQGCTATSCGEGQGCYWLAGLACSWAGHLALGDRCEFADDCQPGLTCLRIGGEGTCYSLCDAADMPACDDTCSRSPITIDPAAGLRACL